MDIKNVAVKARALGQIAAAMSPRVPTRGPSKSADITVDWLTEHLGKSAGAVALSANPLDGTSGTTDRRRLVVQWDETAKAAKLPGNLFIKSSPLNGKKTLTPTSTAVERF